MTNSNMPSPPIPQQALLQPPTASTKDAPIVEVQALTVEEIGYEPVPPRASVNFAVTLRIRGRGRPMPYIVTDGE